MLNSVFFLRFSQPVFCRSFNYLIISCALLMFFIMCACVCSCVFSWHRAKRNEMIYAHAIENTHIERMHCVLHERRSFASHGLWNESCHFTWILTPLNGSVLQNGMYIANTTHIVWVWAGTGHRGHWSVCCVLGTIINFFFIGVYCVQ